MLDVLSSGFKEAKLKFKGRATLSEENVKEAVAAIRKSLLEADVEYSVTKTFIKNVQEKALGQEVALKAGAGGSKMKVSPADHFIKICQDELEALMGPVDTTINFAVNRPTTFMMVGFKVLVKRQVLVKSHLTLSISTKSVRCLSLPIYIVQLRFSS